MTYIFNGSVVTLSHFTSYLLLIPYLENYGFSGRNVLKHQSTTFLYSIVNSSLRI